MYSLDFIHREYFELHVGFKYFFRYQEILNYGGGGGGGGGGSVNVTDK